MEEVRTSNARGRIRANGFDIGLVFREGRNCDCLGEWEWKGSYRTGGVIGNEDDAFDGPGRES